MEMKPLTCPSCILPIKFLKDVLKAPVGKMVFSPIPVKYCRFVTAGWVGRHPEAAFDELGMRLNCYQPSYH